MEEPTDISYYLEAGSSENTRILDIPVSNGEIVSINLVDELPEDPNELISFLEAENCQRKYWIAVSRAYTELGKLDEALEVLNKAIGLSQFAELDRVALQLSLGWLHLKFVSQGIKKNEHITAASELIKSLDSSDNILNLSSLMAEAVLALYKDEVNKALEIFDKLLKLNPKNCFAILGKAQVILNKTKNYTNALKLYQQVLLINPIMKPDPRIGIGLCFWFLKDEKMAVQAWERSLEIDPKNKKAKILLNFASFNRSFSNSLSDEEFVENYKKCLNDLNENYKENNNDPVILLSLISFYFSKGNYDLVKRIIDKIAMNILGSTNLIKAVSVGKLSPFESNILSQCALWMGRITFEKSDFTQSQKYFHESIKLNDNNLLAKLGLGQSQINRKSIEEAIITYESILKTNPKCLEVNYSLGVLYSQQKSRKKHEQAILILERYLKLSNNRGLSSSKNSEGLEFLNKEPVVLNAYLILSRLYESKDLSQSLNYLLKAIDSRKQMNQEAPVEVYNNVGVFNFIKGNYETATEYFQTALSSVSDESNSGKEGTNPELNKDLQISLKFNLARSFEISNQSEAINIYNALLNDCPNYFSAKLRLLFLDCVATNLSTKQSILEEIEELLNINASNLEIRSFYGWFVKNFGKKLGLKPDADTNHQKDTLVQYNSHDCYALISLANIYFIMARDLKGTNQEDKKKKYYIRSIELYSKVLSVDPKNVYAAQGLAVVYIENNESTKGLDILRKIRDSLSDISIYLNLGHVLVDLKQYAKAIENYEIALARYTNGKDSKILSFLGKSWLLRGLSDKNLSYLKKALDYSEEALENGNGVKSSLRFNVSYVQFQIAEFISKMPVEKRLVEDIEQAMINLNNAVENLNLLASDEESHPPYPKADLKNRADLGSTTLRNRLNTCLEETREYNLKMEKKLEDAVKLREEEEAKRLKEEEERLAAQKIKDEELARERERLQEQAQKWAEESRMTVVEDDDDDNLFDEESEKTEKKKKTKKAQASGKGKSKKGRKKKTIIEDSEEESASPSEGSDTEDHKRKIENDDLNDGPSKKKKKNQLSNEVIKDSDEELDDDLFNDKEDEGEGDNAVDETNNNGEGEFTNEA